MANEPRKTPVVDFADHSLDGVIDLLRAVLGRLVALVHFSLLAEPTGYVVAAAPSTDIGITAQTIDLADAGIDQLRIEVYGSTAAGAGIAVVAWDSTNARELCRVALTAVLGLHVGDWSTIKAIGGDCTVLVRVIGDNVNAQTLHHVRLQGRTTQARG